MAQPILLNVDPFDAQTGRTFSFLYEGNQAVKNTLIIRNNETNETVYSATQQTMRLEHMLPANTLKKGDGTPGNGLCYNATITIYDALGQASEPSQQLIFYCFTEPSFSFLNLEESQVIQSSSFNLALQYSQTENEPLNAFQVHLYDYNKVEIFHSGPIYDTENLNYTISGLSDGTVYFLQARGVTVKGMPVDTGVIGFSVKYKIPALYSMVELENVPLQGSIRITSNIVILEGTANPDSPAYLDDTWVDLTAAGSSVTFSKGFNLQSDFTIQFIAQQLVDYSPILILDNGRQKVEVAYMRGKFEGDTEDSVYLYLRAYNALTNYVAISNRLKVSTLTGPLYGWVQRSKNLFSLKLQVMGGDPS